MSTDNTAFDHQIREKWTEKFARFGIIAKGIVYCLIGFLTFMAALDLGGGKANKSVAFQVIYAQPLGKILLIIIAFGLFGYVTWRFFQSVYDIDYNGNDINARFTRIGYAFSAIIYLGLAIYALKLSLNGPPSEGNDSQQFIISKVLSYSSGKWVIGIAALLTIGNGIRQIHKGLSGKFIKNVQLMRAQHSDLYKKMGIIGYISRGIVLIIIGYFFLRAAVHLNASEAIGTKGAFDFLENNFGKFLMGLIALGLFGYGVFMFVKGRYQKIDLNF
jgi:hypothetical protein